MILREAFLALIHMCTQVTSKWIAPFATTNESWFVDSAAYRKIFCGAGLDVLAKEDWEDLIWIDLSSPDPILKFLPRLIEKKPGLIATATAMLVEHFLAMHADGGVPLFIEDELYPELLRNIAKPPLMLSCLGNLGNLTFPSVAAIGSRRASYFGVQQSFNIGKNFSRYPMTVVSGGAIGCDIAVHQGMLAGTLDDVRACVVFAGGLARLYPRRHGAFFDQILCRGGLFISERPWTQSSLPYDFPIRNRIVSGMSEAVIVIQAEAESGSLITANEALDQGREVYVLRHPAGDIRAEGSEQLVNDGALAFSSAEELTQFLGWTPRGATLVNGSLVIGVDTCQMAIIPDTVKGEQNIN